jgi:hypothetical protein
MHSFLEKAKRLEPMYSDSPGMVYVRIGFQEGFDFILLLWKWLLSYLGVPCYFTYSVG